MKISSVVLSRKKWKQHMAKMFSRIKLVRSSAKPINNIFRIEDDDLIREFSQLCNEIITQKLHIMTIIPLEQMIDVSVRMVDYGTLPFIFYCELQE